MKRALITGITGQDGSYLAELLLEKGYAVHGLVRQGGSTDRIEPILRDHGPRGALVLHAVDLSDSALLTKTLGKVQPDEVYHLAAQTHVGLSFEVPEYTADITGTGTVRVLEAIRATGSQARFYQASSSEMFGRALESPQRETTPFYPRSPYGAAKVYGYWITVNYREAHRIHASNGILFNHESPRRGESFVTRKITRALARILSGRQQELLLGNLDAKRDWGYARDYVGAMWLMLQQPEGDDYVIATGETHSVREFLDIAFGSVGRDWHPVVRIDPRYYRPTEVDRLIGDSTKARRVLGWTPRCSFSELVRLMVAEDLRLEGLDPEKWMR